MINSIRSSIISLIKAHWYQHQLLINTPQCAELRRVYSQEEWWKEIGAFISMPGRQCGKSTLITELAEELQTKGEQVVIFVPNRSIKNLLRHRTTAQIYTSINRPGIASGSHHLFVDEFTFVNPNTLSQLLSLPWKSVTMLGTCR